LGSAFHLQIQRK